MAETSTPAEAALLERARAGERAAFDALASGALPRLRAVVRRILAHPGDADDAVQDALVRAYGKLASFDGHSLFSTWLCTIGVRAALDLRRAEKARWRVAAQVAHANECAGDESMATQVGMALHDPALHFDVREHIAHCFACVGRSLPPDEQAALVAREVLGLSARDAARALETSESVFRHRLAAAREEMERSYDKLCMLVSKEGACWQCSGLRELVPAPERRGPALPVLRDLDERLAIVRDALEGERTRKLHDVCATQIGELEARGQGSTEPISGCGT